LAISAPAAFATELFAAVLDDDADAAEQCVRAYIKALRETLAAMESARGNSQPS
jgi:DNA-binding FadR family transcriptional regulator